MRSCRACYGPIESVIDFGVMKLSGFPATLEEALSTGVSAPLDLCQCTSCGLVQLGHTVSPDGMFRQYWYRSGINEAMRKELADVVDDGLAHAPDLTQDGVVVDVGANDGTLLAEYGRRAQHLRIAYEPALNLHPILRRHCDHLQADYFPGGTQSKALYESVMGRVGLLTSIACFYAVDDPMKFVRAVDGLLTRDGVWIVQFQDLHQMIQAGAFDDVCHEHLFYPSLASVERLLEPFNLAIIDAQQRKINGGSLRLVIGRRHRQVSHRVIELRIAERGCERKETLNNFAKNVRHLRRQIRDVVLATKGAGQTIDLYGASTKGNTLLQLCDLGPDLIRQAWERSPAKVGRSTVTGIPIVDEKVGRSCPPDALLVLIWQFRDEVVEREADYLANGGKFIFPLPDVEVLSWSERKAAVR